MSSDVCLGPHPGGSNWTSTSTLSSCSHHWFRGEGALHDPHVLKVARVPSSLLISYLTTITTHTHTQNPLDLLSRNLWVVQRQGSDLIQSGPPHIWPELRWALYPIRAQLFRDSPFLLCRWRPPACVAHVVCVCLWVLLLGYNCFSQLVFHSFS